VCEKYLFKVQGSDIETKPLFYEQKIEANHVSLRITACLDWTETQTGGGERV
jgi:hypothetical protein